MQRERERDRESRSRLQQPEDPRRRPSPLPPAPPASPSPRDVAGSPPPSSPSPADYCGGGAVASPCPVLTWRRPGDPRRGGGLAPAGPPAGSSHRPAGRPRLPFLVPTAGSAPAPRQRGTASPTRPTPISHVLLPADMPSYLPGSEGPTSAYIVKLCA